MEIHQNYRKIRIDIVIGKTQKGELSQMKNRYFIFNIHFCVTGGFIRTDNTTDFLLSCCIVVVMVFGCEH